MLLLSLCRYSLGEGVEKKEANLGAEVEEQKKALAAKAEAAKAEAATQEQAPAAAKPAAAAVKVSTPLQQTFPATHNLWQRSSDSATQEL